jgi:hypothetical protein
MMHLTYSDKDLLVGDEVARLIVEYAASLARDGSADTVEVRAYGSDADEVLATLLLGQGAPIMTETSHTSMNEPDNAGVVAYIRERMNSDDAPPAALPMEDTDDSSMDAFEHEWNGASDGPASR